jgi:hypothetical protein
VCEALKLRDDSAKEAIAARINDLARGGERSPTRFATECFTRQAWLNTQAPAEPLRAGLTLWMYETAGSGTQRLSPFMAGFRQHSGATPALQANKDTRTKKPRRAAGLEFFLPPT